MNPSARLQLPHFMKYIFDGSKPMYWLAGALSLAGCAALGIGLAVCVQDTCRSVVIGGCGTPEADF